MSAAQSPAVDFIKLLYKPGDLLCFGFLRAEPKRWEQHFFSYERALMPDFQEKLRESNEAGNNIYVAMNVFKDNSERTAENVAAIRTAYIDIDKNGPDSLAKVFDNPIVPDPTVVLKSSPGKYQVIWKTEDFEKAEAQSLLKGLCSKFGGDPAVTDLPRVLRLPGFKNVKYPEKPEVEIVHLSENIEAHKSSEFSAIPKPAQDPVSGQPDGDRKLIPHGQLHVALTSQAGKMRHDGHSVEAIELSLPLWASENCEPPINQDQVKQIARSMKNYTQEEPQQPVEIPIIDDEAENDPRFEMQGDHFDTKIYEDLTHRSTPYPNPGDSDWISLVANKIVHGTSIPLAFVREPLKAIVSHVLDSRFVHPAYPELSLRGNYFSLSESEEGKTKGLDFALKAGNAILRNGGVHVENLFRYKSETTFVRSFTPEGTIKRDKKGNIQSGEPGHASQFLYIKEGNQVAHASDYFTAVFAQLTNLYDQTEAVTESMTNGNFTARDAIASTVMCFTPVDFKATFGGKGSIGGGGLNRWGLVNPTPITEYDDKDWERLPDDEIQQAITNITERVLHLCQGDRPPRFVLTEEPGAKKIRLEIKAMLKQVGKVGKRLLDYFMREQVLQAVMAIDGRLVITEGQALYAKKWVEAQLECRMNCWPTDSNNQIEAMEHAIRKAVHTHFVSEIKLRDACHFYREGSGGWFIYSSALKNIIASEAIKWTGRTRKGTRTFCPGSCAIHAPIKEESKKKDKS